MRGIHKDTVIKRETHIDRETHTHTHTHAPRHVPPSLASANFPQVNRARLQAINLVQNAFKGDVRHKVEHILFLALVLLLVLIVHDEWFWAREGVVYTADAVVVSNGDAHALAVQHSGEALEV